jgi:hypothetical protein
MNGRTSVTHPYSDTLTIAQEPPHRAAPTTSEIVNARWLDNLGLGIGVFVVLVAGQWLAWLILYTIGWTDTWHPTLTAIQMWTTFAFFAGLVGFGLLMIWRAALDEREQAGEFVWLRARIEELEAELLAADEEVEQLTVSLNHIRQDLQERIALQQRSQAASQRTYTPAVLRESEEQVAQQTWLDARLLVERACRNLPYSKDKMVALIDGWTQARWREAHALACAAGLFRVAGNRTELLVDDLNTALSMLDIFAGNSVSQPD